MAKEQVKKKPAGKTEELSDEGIQRKIENTLVALYRLQQFDSQIDKIKLIRGELPLEVQDLEDEIVGLETRIENYKEEIQSLDKSIQEKKAAIKDSEALIKKYEEQKMNVRNNREYDSLTKEVEFQTLEIQLAEKRIKEYTESLSQKKLQIEEAEEVLKERKNDLEIKNSELKDIIEETEIEEKELAKRSDDLHAKVDDRLFTAYQRIRKNARNGLAIVQIERDACGGCFNKIPPQHQLDIRMHKKIIVCEYCGRILVDSEIAERAKQN
jgi:predicted  nucleic acid-binding Zn-ribbon protein